MNEKILNIMILIVSVIMIISFIYMFLKSFSVILDYTKVVAENEEKEKESKIDLKYEKSFQELKKIHAFTASSS